MAQVLLLVVSVVVAVAADECMPPKPEEMKGKMDPWKCCDLAKFFPEKMADSFSTCREKHPLPPKPSGPPSGKPDPEMMKMFTCAAECVFTEAGLIKGGKPDKEAIKKVFISPIKDNKELEEVTNTALDKCYDSYVAEIDTSLECKSGALELEKCMLREVYMNCPKDNWNDKPDCVDIKTKLTKCPKLHILSLNPGHKE
uniref:Odorant-binding protein 28 n=1 Tax=Matsumurasca onukii TaxID=2912585 RepID=A0A343WGY4_MATON|nr:odorant-binding protein 28 [Matsumurasca onukii]